MPELHDIVGQDEAVGRLQRATRGQRLPHAFLFVGPQGVGRRTTALAFAKMLLCEEPASLKKSRFDEGDLSFRQACGQCDDCRMIAAGSHPDLQVVYKELGFYHDDANVRERVMQDLGIDVIRMFLIAPAHLAPARGRRKVFVVLETELMSVAAQNALLKTLEEPPGGVTIILICQKPDRLLPTTLSRCAMIRFGLLPRGFVTRRLMEEGLDEAEATFWADFTEGSLGKGLRLARQGMYEIKRDVIERLSGLGSEGDIELAEHLVNVAGELAGVAVATTRKDSGAELSQLLASRRAAGSMLELIATTYRDALTLATRAERRIANADQQRSVEAIASRFTPLRLSNILEAISRCEQLLWRNVNPRMVWNNVVITCASGEALRV